MQIVTADQLFQEDLGRSGLKATDLDAHLAQESELAAVGIRPHLYMNTPGVVTPGYVIPYYDMHGNRAPFYRVKLFHPLPKGAKYLQPQNSGTWLYFPKSFSVLAKSLVTVGGRTRINGFPGAIILTEGEKKAAKACSLGFPTCAVGGVYNWRTRTLILPENTQLVKNRDNQIVAKIESGSSIPATSDRRAFLAGGLEGLIRFVIAYKLQVIIAFDTDNPVNNDVDSACAELAFELRIHGIPTASLRKLEFPSEPGTKVGLDDFLVKFGDSGLDALLQKVVESKTAFPIHPNMKSLLNKRLAGQLDRSEAKELTLMVLSDMDRYGMRMMERNTGSPYYFDSRTKKLMSVNLLQHHSEPLHESKFGEFLYRQYDVGQADMRFVQWLAAGFTGEEPIETVEPRSTMALLSGNRLAVQLDDGHFVIISGDPKEPFKVCENGTEGLLFKADQVEPLDRLKLAEEFKRQVGWLERKPPYQELYWPKALSQFKFNRENDNKVLAVLSYMSPWLLRWNGAQLPVELLVGEPGSGKSTLYSLRLQVLSGRPALRNQPTDVRDWHSSITSQDGLHVIDNVHMVNKELRQRLSDEMCRIVTEPAPYVEMRKLFTTNENFRVPVRTVFAMTSIQQPFLSADIIQRSLILEVAAIGKDFDDNWAERTLTRSGGRVGWLAHQLAVLHLFFRKVSQGGWNPNYKSSHRLANFEQMFRVIGGIIGVPDAELVGGSLAHVAETQVSEYDWTMEGLKQFGQDNIQSFSKDPRKKFTLQDVASWAMANESFEKNELITDPRRLARYIKSHKYMVEKVCGFTDAGRYGNRDAYRLVVVP